MGDPSGRQRPTIYDVARLAGVSTATVSRALNGTGQIAPATRATIDAAVEQLGYRPNTIARSLVTRSTQTIALLLPDITNPFYAALVSGIQQAALARDYTMLLCTTEGDAEREEHYLRLLRAKQVDGALVDGLVLPPDRIARFVEDGFPIVCLDRDIDSRVDSARAGGQSRWAAGSRLSTSSTLGHTRIAHVTGAGELGISDERLAGYRDALTAARHASRLPTSWRKVGSPRRADTTPPGRCSTRQPDLTAIFAANDLSALGRPERRRRKRSQRVPDDVSVVGFDDLRLAAYTSPPLTTIQPAGASRSRGSRRRS